MPNVSESTLNEIVEAIQSMSPSQRRQLQKRLQVSGLLVPDLLLSDQNRLTHALALGLRGANAHRRISAQSSAQSSSLMANKPSPAKEPPDTAVYRSPVSGQVVFGEPTSQTATDPHAMLPLPGQAPEQPESAREDLAAASALPPSDRCR